MKKQISWIISLLFLLAACNPAEEPIPTLAHLADPTDTPPPTIDLQRGFEGLPPTETMTPTETDTPSRTPTAAPTFTPTVTVTPSATITNTPTATFTPLPTIPPESRPLIALALTAEAATLLPTDFVVPPYAGIDITLAPQQQATQLPEGVPSPIPPLEAATSPGSVTTITCPTTPPGGFGAVFVNNPTIAAQLGCPLTAAEQNIPAAWQAFQQGIMVWLNGEVLVFYQPTGQFQSFADTFTEGVDPQTSSEVPPAGLYTPIRGFLKVWSGNPGVRSGLGWGLNPEQGVTAKALTFQNGRMIWLPGRGDILVVLTNSTAGAWQSFGGTF